MLDDVIKAIEKDRDGIVKNGLFHTKNAVVKEKTKISDLSKNE